MNIFYIANIRLPTEKAHGLQIMKMCESFSSQQLRLRQGFGGQAATSNQRFEVELIVPKRLNPIKQDPFKYYGVKENFKITRLPVLDLVRLGRLGFLLESLIFSKVAAIYLFFKKADVIYYGRDELPLYFLSFFKKNIFWEAHQGRMNITIKRLLKKAAGVITISEGLKNFYQTNREDILVSPDAVDFDEFNIPLSREECRQKLNKYLPPDKKIVLYVGHLYEWKGIYTLLEASHVLEDYASFVFLGGTEKDSTIFRSGIKDLKYVQWVPHQPHQDIPKWLKAADILILPNSAVEEISRLFTSPLKLFEYLASGTPIIASDLPSIREIVSENEVLFFRPDDAEDLRDKIKYAFEHEDEMLTKADSAKQLAQKYTWSKRAENILFFISKNLRNKKPSDFWPAFFAGLGITLLSLPILINLSVLDSFFSVSRGLFYGILALWIVLIPSGAVFGIYLARLWGKKKPVVLQVARYGLIGWLNTFVYAGIFNLLSWLTGVASGLAADFLVFIAFIITVTNSFFWNKNWVFEHSDSGRAKVEYIKFFGVTGFVAILNIFVFHLIVNTIGAPAALDEKIWANIAILIQIPISFLGNFFGYKILVFNVINVIIDR